MAEDTSLLIVCATAFVAVVLLLSLLSVLMRLLSFLLPEKAGTGDDTAKKISQEPEASVPTPPGSGAKHDRQKAAAAVAVLLEMEREAAAAGCSREQVSMGGWKLAGRLERV